MLGILISVLVFGLIILIHEAGHFLLAKMNGIVVQEFSVGMGPKLLFFKRGDTIYSIKALPIGGSCALLGEEDDSTDKRAFHNKGVAARISVVAAGPGFNFLLAFLLALVIVSVDGYSVPGISGVEEGTPASEAGIKAGDVIKEVNGGKIVLYSDYLLYRALKPDERMEKVRLTRLHPETGERVDVTVGLRPKYDQETGKYLAGVTISPVRVKADSLVEMLKYSFYEVKYNFAVTFESLGMLINGKASIKDLAGPVGITSMIEQNIKAGLTVNVYGAVINVLNISILLSVNLGIMNLLPIPVLDGGRILLLCLEAIRHKRLNMKTEKVMNTISMTVLLSLMFLVVLFDIGRL